MEIYSIVTENFINLSNFVTALGNGNLPLHPPKLKVQCETQTVRSTTRGYRTEQPGWPRSPGETTRGTIMTLNNGNITKGGAHGHHW